MVKEVISSSLHAISTYERLRKELSLQTVGETCTLNCRAGPKICRAPGSP